jgi:MFS family permease
MRSRIVGRILAAQALSSIGTSMSTVALAFMVYTLTGSVLQMGGIMAASTIPLVLTAWVGGAFLDRYSARTIMVVSDLVRAALIFSMPFLAGHVIGLVYVIAALMGVFSGVFNPGQIKLVGEIVEQDRLVRVNSYLGVARDGAELLGYLAGGVVASVAGLALLGVTITGYTLAFVIDAISYAVSAVLLLGLPRGLARGAAAPAGAAPRLRTLMAESPRVFASLWRRPVLRTNLLLAVFATAAVMMNVPNSYILAVGVFKVGPLGLGALEVFVAVGLMAGGVIISTMRLSGDKNGYVLFSVAAMAICYIAVGFSSIFWVSITLMGLAGVANVGGVVSSITMFQSMPASPDKGRLIALRSSFGQLGVAAGFAVGGLVGQLVGVKPAFMVTGGATIVVGLLIYVPYRLGASRRRRMTWTAATQAGATRSAALQLARQAAFSGLVNAGGGLGGPGLGTAGWAAAEAVEAIEAAEAGEAAGAAAGTDAAQRAGSGAVEAAAAPGVAAAGLTFDNPGSDT